MHLEKKYLLIYNSPFYTDFYSDKKNSPQYKYKEVVRGKDKRAKLNGYFCADCEKVRLKRYELSFRLLHLRVGTVG